MLIWIIFAYIVVSATEHFAHRFVMHNSRLALRWARAYHEFESHAVLHHGRYYGRGHFTESTDPASRHISIELPVPFMLVMTSWMWGPLMAFSFRGGLTLCIAFVLHGIIWTNIHREMHEPKKPWWAKTSLFRYLRTYHYAHHEDTKTNYNVVCPLFDDLMGTRSASW